MKLPFPDDMFGTVVGYDGVGISDKDEIITNMNMCINFLQS